MSRGRWAGLLAVLLVLVAAVAYGARDAEPTVPPVAAAPVPGPSGAAVPAGSEVVPGLPPCPTALTTALEAASLPCFDGGPSVQVSGAPGTPLVVNLWATWCEPCVEEVPLLVELAASAGDRLGVVGVVHQDDPASVVAFADAFGVNYPLVRDDAGDTLRTFGSAPPRTLFVTAQGEVVFEQVGAFADSAELEALVAEHLGVQL